MRVTVFRHTPAPFTAPAIESVSEAAQSSPIDSASDARNQFRVELPVEILQIVLPFLGWIVRLP